ncbi:MAG: ATP phosphoribosyltransferase regulatory subunit [Sulfobacillus sp.]
MNQWLRQNLEQYQLLVRLLTGLLDRGFYPIPTAPTGQQTFRVDHTLAIIDSLNRFPDMGQGGPLKIFSTGPVYQPTSSQWTETLDVEILGGSDSESLGIVDDLLGWLCDGENRPHMVIGDLQILTQTLTLSGITKEDIDTFVGYLRTGNRVDAESLLARRAPSYQRLFHIQSWDGLEMKGPFAPPVDRQRWMASLSNLSDVSWDLASVGTWPYYNGLVFSLYGKNIGQPLIRGGQFQLALGERVWRGIGFTVFVGAYELFARGVI